MSLILPTLLALLACGDKMTDSAVDDTAVDTTTDTDGGTLTDSGGGADSTDETTPTGGDDTSSFCDEAATVTYNNFGRGFMTENCQGCHASTAPNRYGAPDNVIFDEVEDCWGQVDRILTRSTGESPSMPPQGGVSEDDRTKLEWWLVCATPGT